jgi:hypothetical protein
MPAGAVLPGLFQAVLINACGQHSSNLEAPPQHAAQPDVLTIRCTFLLKVHCIPCPVNVHHITVPDGLPQNTLQNPSLLAVQWLHLQRRGEGDNATAVLQRLCAEPSSASASLILKQPAADVVKPAARLAAVQGRAAFLLTVAALRQEKAAIAAGAWDAIATHEQLRAANAFSASAALLQELSATSNATDLAGSVWI